MRSILKSLRLAAVGAVVLSAWLVAFGLSANSAFADRTFDSKIPGFYRTSSVAFDANGNAWITDYGHTTSAPNPGENGLYEYNPYPSQTLLDTPDTHTPWPNIILDSQVAVDNQNGEIFVAQGNGRAIDIFDPSGTFSKEWNSINGSGGVGLAGLHVAIDNTNTYSRGRIYLSLTATENYVEIVDADERPVDFPATASYITDNKLTGTPSGPFGQVQQVTVDSSGNLYVTDAGNLVVDEFDSSGTFLRSFPAPLATGGIDDTGGVAVDPTNGNVLITDSNLVLSGNGAVNEYDASGNLLETLSIEGAEGTPAVDSNGYLYVPRPDRIDIYSPNAVVPAVIYKSVSSPTSSAGSLNATVDPNGGGSVTTCHFDYGTDTTYSLGPVPCSPDPAAGAPGSNFSSPTDVHADISSLTPETTYHYRVVVTNANGIKYGADQTFTPHDVVGLRTDPASNVASDSATLNANVVGDGSPTHYYFEWGPTSAYGNTTAAAPGDDAGSPNSATPLSTQLTGLAPYSTYHYRVVATNGAGTSDGEDQMFTTTPGVPSARGAAATEVHADRVLFHGEVNPNGADTTVDFEYVDDANYQQSGWTDAKATSPGIGVGMSKHYQTTSLLVNGLDPGTLYHYRVVGTNDVGSGNDAATFKTFGFTPSYVDPCPNAHVRQQTGAALLLDCRAYELASASNAGGYDVESSLIPGQTPFGDYPNAENPSQILYGVHNGGIPGTGDPTNNGVDPYVATRASDGWTTKYVGIPADVPSAAPFSSTLEGADAGLDTFAFSGPGICNPCFGDGSQGIPIHNADGTLTQGMVGSLPVADPVSAGTVEKPFSDDGSHFVFGSEQQFEPTANPGNGNVTIYDRDLKSGTTEVASTDGGGTALADGSNVAELDVSSDGSRVLIGDLVNTDSAGNKYWHLYMHIAGSSGSVDLMPGSTSGGLYDGMSADGTKVYFTSPDHLTSDDTDSSADIFRADVGNSSATVTKVSTGSDGSGDTDSCNPAANTSRPHWNSVGPDPTCDAVAVGGRAGVASGDGTIYFLSPEKLDGDHGVQEAPNLYIDRPGDSPHFIRTLESSANAPLPPVSHPFLRSFGAFPNPSGVAIDHSTGDIYVLDIGVGQGTGFIYKFDSSGHPIQSFGTGGTLTVSGTWGGLNLPTQLAVDNDPSSPNYRDLYVPELLNRVVGQFSPSGAHLSDLSPVGFQFPTGVAVDPSSGNVYVAEGYIGSSVDIFGTGGNLIRSFPTINSPTSIGVDSSGNAYVANGGGYFAPPGGLTEKYDSSGNDLGRFSPDDGNVSFGVAVDPSNEHVYIDEGSRVAEFDSSGNPVGAPTGSGLITGSFGVAADSDSLVIANPGKTTVSSYGPGALPSDPNTDSPVVVDSVSSAGVPNTADFQVNSSGDDAIFTSTLPLTGYDNAAHREVFRYDAPSDTVDCASCNPTGEQATGEATLATNGSSLTQDGRVFFNSTEGLVDRDLNNRLDAYEWEKGPGAQEGTIELISTGTSALDSSLLGVSADGTDAYFFTRETLVSGDDNGTRVKIYDARAGGGFDQAPPAIQCQASDECHGAGSPAPPALAVRSITGSGSDHPATTPCKKGFVKRHGSCVRKPKHHKKRHLHHHRKAHHHG